MKSRFPAALVISLLSLASPAVAGEVSTSFEFFDLSGAFSLGSSPNRVTFLNGEAKTIGFPPLYHSGSFALMVTPGNTAEIIFETPAESLQFFLRDQVSSVNGRLRLFDPQGNQITQVNGTAAFWQEVLHDTANPPVARITLEHQGPTGHTVIDDFTFCAQGFGSQVLDPIPSGIPESGPLISLVPVATGLVAPNWGTFAPGITRTLFVSDQTGQIHAVNIATGDRFIFLNVINRLVPLGVFGPGTFDERGLLGFAFHPDYPNNGRVYTYTSEPVGPVADFSTIPPGGVANHQSVVTEWRVRSPRNPHAKVDQSTRRELLRIDQPQFNHNGGALDFGPDGMLHISLGDGGGADDIDNQDFLGSPIIGHGLGGNGQNPNNVLGTVLRIDPLGSDSANGNYGIPGDNPFLAGGGAPEVFAFGLRNPFRISFDERNGTLYIADVGQNDIEEIDIGVSGANYGWNAKEGSFFFVPNGNMSGFVTDVDPGNVPLGVVDPVAEYDHDEGSAIIGGFVYRGSRLPSLWGHYVFGEFDQPAGPGGRLFTMVAGQIRELPLATGAPLDVFVLGFGQDFFGEVYLMGNTTGTPSGSTGVVLKLTRTLASFGIHDADSGPERW